MRTTRGFTLVELLVVVVIITILAAVAIPNFLDAQIRSKVSRTRADLRTGALAVEAYAVDHNAYPPSIQLHLLSTPVAYVSAGMIPDLFAVGGGYPAIGYVEGIQASQPAFLQTYGITATSDAERSSISSHGYFLFSNGPDRVDDALNTPRRTFDDIVGLPGADLGYYYDPTNGTVSRGDILRSSKVRG